LGNAGDDVRKDRLIVEATIFPPLPLHGFLRKLVIAHSKIVCLRSEQRNFPLGESLPKGE
jgi:hypothetical protein